MYDELVKRLRASVDGRYEKCDGCPYEEDYPCCVDCLDKMHKQAADAIEELSADCDMYRKGMTDEHNKAARLLWDKEHCWIPVTERLPDAGSYLALTTPFINSCKPFARILRFSENLESVDRYDFEGINRSGWYYYDDEYGNIEVVTVTHWMPLPDPPKEETE